MRRIQAVLAAFVTAGSLAAQPAYDVVLRGGNVFDGGGKPAVTADVAIRGDSVVAVGSLPSVRARLELDVRGFAVAPGFIDIHTHARHGVFRDPNAANYIRQGVATLIEGNDGDSPLPLRPFLDRLSRTPIAVNYGTFAGHGTVRQSVLALENRKATSAEIQKMKSLVEQAMRDGAFGLSTGLFYVPGSYSPTEEVIELARAAGRLGGIYISHIRDEAAGILASVRETIRIGEKARLPIQITHHKIVGRRNWGKSVETLRLVVEARARGIDVTLDQYHYTASSTGTTALFPQWSLEGGFEALARRLQDPAQRAKIKAEVMDRILYDRGGGDPRNIVMADCPFDPSLNGRNLAEIAGEPPTVERAAETLIDLQTRGGCAAIYHALDERDVERILRFPFTMIASDGEIPAFGEGAPHPRSYGTFVRVLGRYVRERRLLSLEEAIRKMTSLPASRLSLKDRGLLHPGMKADIVVFDPATIADRATFQQPHQYASGVKHVFVNGKPVILDGRTTGERPGRVLYGPGRALAERFLKDGEALRHGRPGRLLALHLE